MKKQFISLFVVAFFVSCGGSDPKKDAQEICDCMLKTNQLPAGEASRSTQQDKCEKLHKEKWESYKNDVQKMSEFTIALSECSKTMLEESMKSTK